MVILPVAFALRNCEKRISSIEPVKNSEAPVPDVGPAPILMGAVVEANTVPMDPVVPIFETFVPPAAELK